MDLFSTFREHFSLLFQNKERSETFKLFLIHEGYGANSKARLNVCPYDSIKYHINTNVS